ncbi:hypothetical protein SAMN04488483_6073 [Pseudomonas helmanticensis]|uniref:Uncharacterized protein n=1 Tax=Pseudomonas helmanticensis TaxID=1471381 RepID=A0ACD2UF00_9PSED|nr:hypothetical protein SAMN04488483_6073 [Pseudomonas helmanticensis]
MATPLYLLHQVPSTWFL